MSDPDLVDFYLSGLRIAVEFDYGSRKTVGRRWAYSRTFKITRILGRAVAARLTQGTKLCLRSLNALDELDAAVGEADASNLSVGHLKIVRRYLENFSCHFKQL